MGIRITDDSIMTWGKEHRGKHYQQEVKYFGSALL